MEHELLPEVRPQQEEVWQVVETLLAPEGKACSEATPTVDAKLPRDPELDFGGARLKVLHPPLVVGEYPVLSLRLYEPKPVPPQQIVEWGVFPETVVEQLLEAVEIVDDSYGVIVKCRQGRRRYDFPLADMKATDRKSPNYQLVDDYGVWLSNRW